MRTTKKEREKNARQFYQNFMNGNCDQTAVVVYRKKSNNPHISRCQFVAIPYSVGFMSPVVIAESVLGIDGCFMEFLSFIKSCSQKTYHEDGFNEWLHETYGFEITYQDGLVFMLRRM